VATPAEPDADATAPGRRAVLIAGALLPVVRWMPVSAAAPRANPTAAEAATVTSYRFLTAHQAAVVIEATARLVPGPLDDPSEVGHPGAREAGVVHFIDRLLSAFDEDPPAIFAGAPWSNRHASGRDHLARFQQLVERQEKAWRKRIKQLKHDVTAAVTALDKAAKDAGFADFLAAPAPEQDRILTEQTDARNVLFGLTIDAMYSVPEYGGNNKLVGWQEIGWPGDIQPVGYSKAKVEGDDGPDPVPASDQPAVQELIDALPILSRARAARGVPRG
jgi:hypothetical protein